MTTDSIGPRGVRPGRDFQSMRQKAHSGKLAGKDRGLGMKARGQEVTQAPPGSRDMSAGLSPEAVGRKPRPIGQSTSTNNRQYGQYSDRGSTDRTPGGSPPITGSG